MTPILVLAIVVLLVAGAAFLGGSRPLAWVLGLAALAAVAGGAAFLLRSTSAPTAPPVSPPTKSPAPATPAPAPAPAPRAPSGAAVAGRVLRGAEGEDPVAGASVEVFALDGGPVPFLAPLAKGESGADGRFRVGGLEKGSAYRVRGSQEGLSSTVVHAGAGDEQVQIRLLAGTFVAGLVKDAETKAPVAGARVQVDDAVGTTTGPDGAYRLDRIPEGDTMVSATAPGYAEGHQYVKTGRSGKEGVVVLLPPACSVAGVVLDAAGAPAAGADVTVALFRDIPMAGRVPAGKHEAKTGADGRFRVEGLPVGQALQVSARSEDGFAAPVDAGPLEKGKPAEGLVLRLSPAAVLVVTVLDDAGKPVAGVSVTAAHEEEKTQEAGDAEPAETDAGGEVAVPFARGFPTRDRSSATTDEAGVARVRSVPPGRTRVSAQKEDFVRAHQSVDAVAAAETALTLKLVQGSTVTGKVVDDLGKPVSGASVSVMRFQGGDPVHETRQSGEDGSFRIGGLKGSGFQLNAMKEGHAPASLESMDPAAGPVTVTLPRGGVVAGVVVDEEGKAVASFRASANRTDSGAAPDRMAMLGMAGMGATAFDDPTGRFRLEGLAAGTYTVEAKAPDYAPGRSAEIAVEAGSTAEVRIVLPRGLALHGIVVRKTGEAPVAGAKVTVSQGGIFGEMDVDFDVQKPTEDGEAPAADAPEDAAASAGSAIADAMGMAAGPSATTGPDGRFVLRGLEAGTVDLRVKAKDLAPVLHKGVAVPSESEVRIALAEGASLEGTVYDAQRAPKSGAMVMLQRLPATMKMATTDAKGRYRIADVAPGNYIVYFMESADGMMNAGGGMNLKSESVTLEEGKTLVKDHRFGEGVRVSGKVTRGGKPVPNMMVMLIPGSGKKDATSAILGGSGFAMATTGEDGRYEITGLSPGVYTAMVQTGMGGGPAPGDPVEIAAGAVEVRRDIVLSRNVVRGIVVDDAGKPVAQAQVSAIVTGKESARVADLGEAVASMGGQVMSGEDGRFTLEDVNPGSYTVKASAAGRSAAFVENVVPTEAGAEVRLVLAKGVDVTVRVVDAEGKPVSGAGVYLADARGMDLSGMEMFDARRTGADGKIVVNAPQGTVRFEAVVRGHAPGMTTAATDSPEVVITLPRGATLEVVVTDAGGSPVAGASIRLLDAAGIPYAPRMTMEGMGELMTPPATGSDGKYVRADLPAGSYVVRAAIGERTADAAVTLVGGEKKAATVRLP